MGTVTVMGLVLLAVSLGVGVTLFVLKNTKSPEIKPDKPPMTKGKKP